MTDHARVARGTWIARRLLLLAIAACPAALLAPLPRVSAQSPPAPLERCRDTPRAVLTGSNQWTLTYSWTGGYGPGDVRVTVAADGRTRVETTSRSDASGPPARDVRLPADIVAKLARQIDDTGLLCETPQLRRYRVFDIGRYAVRVRQGSYDKEVYVDECHALQTGAGLAAVAETLQSQEQLLGPAVAWGPYASTTGGPCTGP